ncbi:uncharacterized protein LOC118491477 [Helianthus annuus]|uniref:uncharacterized protein LOC118491477 n=1 Tax=Helianthus annuus TaxID=4232 RepID=UPI001652C10E|nr:uncharacterized protein LOC118491477 [Helianthus annuus]
MDKSWIFSDRLSNAYEESVEAFLEFAQSNNPKSDVILCPCVDCTNFRYHSIDDVRYHLVARGFHKNYKVWSFHGETLPNLDSSIPNKSRHPDFDYTTEMLHDAFTYVENEPDSLKLLLEECDKPLYEGSKYNALSGLLKFQHLKGQFGWSDASFNALLGVLKDILPSNNTIPDSLYEAKKLLKGVGLKYEKIHACENDCVLFWKEHKDASQCPTCGTSRWKKNTKNVPSKVLWYFPPIPRFKRMFSSPEIAHDLTWHAKGRVNDGKLTHPRDSPSWKLVDNTWKEFGGEDRNLRLALSADGPKQPGNNIDVYLAPLIDDLKLLWETGVETFDAHKKEYFNLRAVLLWTINDFPAYGNLSGCVTKGYYACPICSENTCSQWLPKSKKVCYLEHRRFLPRGHPFRKRKKDFNKLQENDVIKNPLSGEEIYDYLAGFENRWGKKKKSKKKKSKKKKSKKKTSKEEKESIDERTKFWHKKSIFYELEYWKKLLVRHQLDVMHIEKNVCESIYGTLLNLPHKTKDGLNARQDLEELGIKPELQPQPKGNRLLLPPACYTLNTSEKHQFYDTLSNIKVPDGYCSNFKNLVSDDVSKMNGLKSNDCHVLMQQLLPFAIKGLLHEKYARKIAK